jgi:hypothetical protein
VTADVDRDALGSGGRTSRQKQAKHSDAHAVHVVHENIIVVQRVLVRAAHRAHSPLHTRS